MKFTCIPFINRDKKEEGERLNFKAHIFLYLEGVNDDPAVGRTNPETG
jgi:hypothetical protein